MKVDRKNLLEILTRVKPALAIKDFVEGGTHFIFDENQVFSFNDKIAISSPSPVHLNCSVSSQEFYSLLSQIADEEIDLTIEEECLNIQGSAIKAGLTILRESESLKLIRSIDFESLGPWFPLPKDFLKGLSLCGFSCSKDATLDWMTCIWISGGSMLSTDDIRVTSFNMMKEIESSFFLPLTSAQSLIKFLPVEYCLKDGWAHFREEKKVIFSSRILDSENPEENIEEFFNVQGTELFLTENKTFLDVIKRVGILEDKFMELDRKISIKIEGRKVIIEGKREGIGWIREELLLDTYNENLRCSFKINPSFLWEILTIMPSLIIIIGETTCLFKSDNFRHVMALPLD